MSLTANMTLSAALFTGNVLASDPSVYRDGDDYILLFTDLDPLTGNTIVSMARSTDGTNWVLEEVHDKAGGALIMGSDYGIDNIETATAFSAQGTNMVLASGYSNDASFAKGFPADLYLFNHDDDLNVIQVGSDPILERTPGWYDNDAIYSPTVIETDTGFVMYYVGHSYSSTDLIDQGGVYLLAATSADGVSWTKHPEPILSPGDGPDWAAGGFAEPELVVDDAGAVHLFFTGIDGEERAIGYARADTPLGPFEIAEEPIISPDMIGSDEIAQVLAPSVEIVDGEVKVWFLAYNTKGEYQIAQADTTTAELDGLFPEPIIELPVSDVANSNALQEDQPVEAYGTDEDNTLYGSASDDLLVGMEGDDVLISGSGSDALVGGVGNDRINGGEGNDWLDSGSGADVFVFEGNFGEDVVKDFDLANDTVQLSLSKEQYEAFDVKVVDDVGLQVNFGDDSILFLGLEWNDLEHMSFEIL